MANCLILKIARFPCLALTDELPANAVANAPEMHAFVFEREFARQVLRDFDGRLRAQDPPDGVIAEQTAAPDDVVNLG